MTALAFPKLPRLTGRTIYVDRSGREVAKPTQPDDSIRQRTNGPHHDAKWGRYILGTDISQAEYRRRRLAAIT